MINDIETQQLKMMMQAIKERDQAVNERQRLIDSNRELVELLEDCTKKLPFSWDKQAFLNEIETAINNAKNLLP